MSTLAETPEGMTKITRKEYIKLVENTSFISCVYGQEIEAVRTRILNAKSIPTLYHIARVAVSSNHVTFHKKGGGYSNRYFSGLNMYLKDGDMLYHLQKVEGEGMYHIFINM